MKFSIATLLVLMLASAFSMLAYRSFQKTEDINAKILDLQNQIATDENQYLIAKHRLDLLEQFESQPARTNPRQEAERNFRTLQDRYGKLEIEDPTKPAIVRLPMPAKPSNDLHVRFRVFVPANQKLELAGFVKDRNGTRVDASYFRPDRFVQVLPAGEHAIDFQYQAHGGKGLRDSIIVSVLGTQLRQEVIYVPLERSLSAKVTEIKKQYEPFRSKSYIRLVSMTHFKNRRTDTLFNLVIRKVEGEK